MKTPLLTFAAASVALTAFSTVRYVDVNSTNATPPYTNWVAAATNIQQAVNVASAGDEILVTNGIYATGAGISGTNDWSARVSVNKPLKVTSVNGSQVTLIDGSAARI